MYTKYQKKKKRNPLELKPKYTSVDMVYACWDNADFMLVFCTQTTLVDWET